jgi:aspartyl protease family protein
MRFLFALLAATVTFAAHAANDVNVIGLFPGKAVITVNRGNPRTISVGEKTPDGILLVSTTQSSAVIEIDGVRQTYDLGQHFATAGPEGTQRESVTLSRDGNGHFMTEAQVNGGHIRFMVDTGATLVVLPMAEAQRLGIDYTKGRVGYSIVADGRRVTSYRVMLDSITVGEVTIYNVDASIQPGNGIPLLGMSFLSRMEMRNEGQNLTLTRRY